MLVWKSGNSSSKKKRNHEEQFWEVMELNRTHAYKSFPP